MNRSVTNELSCNRLINELLKYQYRTLIFPNSLVKNFMRLKTRFNSLTKCFYITNLKRHSSDKEIIINQILIPK